MNEEQQQRLLDILIQVWYRELSADEGYEEIEDLINETARPRLCHTKIKNKDDST